MIRSYVFSGSNSLRQVGDGPGRLLIGVGLVHVSTDVPFEVGQLQQEVDDVLVRICSVAEIENQSSLSLVPLTALVAKAENILCIEPFK